MKKFLLSLGIAVFILLGYFGFTIGFNLDVPFTSQAPHANWRQPWQDTCEETSIAMIDFFYSDKKFTPDLAAEEILKVFRLKEKLYGPSLDENAAKMTDIINRFYSWEAYTVKEPSLEMIKVELKNGRPIVVPVYGKALQNVHLQGGGPVYHVLVLSGFDDNTKEFIAQEPGTKFGENYRYSYETIMTANHDYLPNKQTPQGEHIMIFTSPIATERSLFIDGDQDGLNKEQEIEYGSVIWLTDSDGDGYSDGVEVDHGYSPTIAGKAGKYPEIKENSLIKIATDPRVYLIKDGKRHHIKDEQTFISRGWLWIEVKVVPVSKLEGFELGEEITV